MKYYKLFFVLLTIPLSLFSHSMGGHEALENSPEIRISKAAIVEGNTGQRTVSVMLTISEGSAGPVTLAYITRDGSATAGSDYVAKSESVAIEQGKKMIRINIIIQCELLVEPDETFKIILTKVSGATLRDSVAMVTIINDDFKGNNFTVYGLTGMGQTATNNNSQGNNSLLDSLTIAGNSAMNVDPSKLAIYEVRVSFFGYRTFYGPAPDCPIRRDGNVVLTGLLYGIEDVDPTDDIGYAGLLELDIDIDICSVTHSDESQFCGITVVGRGPVQVDLEMYFDDRGAYMKINGDSNQFFKMVTGSCEQAELNDERGMVPNESIASVFNGMDFSKVPRRTLSVGQWVEEEAGNKTVLEVLRKIR